MSGKSGGDNVQNDVLQSAQQQNPHISRIALEHCYALTHHNRVLEEHNYASNTETKK